MKENGSDSRNSSWRERPKLSTGGEIGPRAQVFIRLVETAVTHTLIVNGSRSKDTQPFAEQSKEALATVRDEVRKFGFHSEAFELVVKDKIELLQKQAAEKEEDYRLLRGEFPGVFPDYDRQAELGDVPPNINFGNHARKADAGGFEPKRRGW